MVQRGKKLLSLLLTAAMVASLVVVPAFATDTPDTTGTTGEAQDKDKNNEGGGSEGTPQGAGRKDDEASGKPFQVGEQSYATLQEAFDAILKEESKTGTIIVTSDVTVDETARCTGTARNITIKSSDGNRFTITRGEIKPEQDNARSTYNPAMIEIDGTLRLENIVLDDGDKIVGKYFAQASTDMTGETQWGGEWGPKGAWVDSDKSPNSETVQDAIIAIYDGGDEIVLGNGAELRNFGGMSAVRLSGGKMTMERGSKITNGGKNSQNGLKNGTGTAGAVWIQGGELVMEEGSEINGVNGRAVYVDGGKATVNGTISGIIPDKKMWWGEEGVGFHVRNGADVTLNGTIEGNENGTGTGVTVVMADCRFTMNKGATIKNVNKGIAASAGEVLVDGEITGMTGSNAVNIQGANVTIGANANIHHNKVWYGAIYCQNNSTLKIYGKIEYNYSTDNGGGVCMANNSAYSTAEMFDGASISHNIATNSSGGLLVSNCTFTMHGGTISNNIARGEQENGKQIGGSGVFVRRGGTFIMESGTISGNITAGHGGGLAYESGVWNTDKQANVDLRGGTFSDNVMNAVVTLNPDQLTATTEGGTANDFAIKNSEFATVGRAFSIAPAVSADRNIFMQKTVADGKIVTVTDGTKLGNASSTDVTALTAASTSRGWKDPMATVWAQNTNPVDVTVAGVAFDGSLPVYVLVKNGEEVKSLKADLNNGIASFAAPGSENGTSIALAQPSADYGTLTLTAAPNQLKDNDTPSITYTLTYEPSTNVTSSADSINDDVTLDVPAEAVTKEELLTGFTRTWTESVTFENGKAIEKSAALTFTLDRTQAEVPSNLAVTWMESRKDVTVTFDSAGGSSVSPLTVKEGETISQPAAPTRSGYTFNNWTLNGSAYDFTAPVIENITLVAQWTQNSGGGGTGGGGGGGGDIDIPDDPTPLGGDLQLNREDHFAYVSGYPDSSVQPGGHITREEVATIFYRLLTEQSKAIYGVTTNNFNDVEAERWSNEAISTLANAQVLQGYADGGFHPGDPITRAEFTAIVTRFDEVDSAPASPFSDTAGHWAEDVIAFAASKNWVGGYPDGSFRPQSDITRAEAMTMINNILDRLVDEEGILAEARQWPDNAKDAWYYYAVQEATNAHDYTRRSADGIVENWTALR